MTCGYTALWTRGAIGANVRGTADGVDVDATGIGVHGKTAGTGSAGFGEATAGGAGVNGTSATGIGVDGTTTSGSGVHGPSGAGNGSSAKRQAAGTGVYASSDGGVASMVIAIAQEKTSVSVRAAVPGSGSFTIRLSGKAPASALEVAYFVLN